MTYNTRNPLGSNDPRDLFDNAQNFDKALNELVMYWIDRLGVQRLTEYGRNQLFNQLMAYFKEKGEEAITAVGWQELGDWAIGLQLTNRNQIVSYNGSWYKFLGELPHTIAGDSPDNDGGIWSSSNTAGVWANIGDAALRSNLGSSEEGMGSWLVNGNKYFSVHELLARIKTLSDIGATPSFGHNNESDALIISDAPRDNALLLSGRLCIAAKGKGVARAGVGLSVRMGAGDYGLYPQVVGVASTQALANYGRPDLVSAYFDLTGQPYEDWEKIDSPTYAASGFTASDLDTDNLEPDMVVRTLHDTPWTGTIESISGDTVTLKDGWWQASASEATTPTSGTGLRVNPFAKGWVHNLNLLLLPNSRIDKGVVSEWGISNRVGFNTEIGGLDLVTLGTSTYDSNFGIRVRMANDASNRFRYGFVAQACVNGFTSTPLTINGTEYAPTYGFQANGNHTAAFIAANIGNGNVAFQNTDTSGVVRYRVAGSGLTTRQHRAKLWISSDTGAISDNYPVICTAAGIAQTFTIAALSYVNAEFSIFKYYSSGVLTIASADTNARFFYKDAYSTTLTISTSCMIILNSGGTTSSPVWYVSRFDASTS